MEKATQAAKMCSSYEDVIEFSFNDAADLAIIGYPTKELRRLAARSALQNLLTYSRIEAQGYRNETEKMEAINRIDDNRLDALQLAKELGMDPAVIESKFDKIDPEPYMSMDEMMKEWYPNPITRAYVQISDKVRRYFSKE